MRKAAAEAVYELTGRKGQRAHPGGGSDFLPFYTMDGRITAKSLGNGKTRVTIPRMSGLSGNNSVLLTFYGISGKPEYKSKIVLNPYAPTYLSVKLRKGAYLVKVEIDGKSAGRAKVIAL